MSDVTYVELISANLLVSVCCVCDMVVGYKDAQRELMLGDDVKSHTYCPSCMEDFKNNDVDY